MFEILTHIVSLGGFDCGRAKHAGILDDPIAILVNRLQHIL